MKRCVIFGSVDIDFPVEKMIRDSDVIFCADRGWENAVKHGIKPDFIVGDFDSSEKPDGTDADITVLPTEKDDTDTYHIAKTVIENGFTDVLMVGLLGGKRIEHTFANIQTMLYFAKNRVNATAADKYSSITVIQNGRINLPPMENKFFSVFSLGEKANGISIKGAKYTVEDADISNDYPIGVSNEFCGCPVEISVKDGALLIVITEKD